MATQTLNIEAGTVYGLKSSLSLADDVIYLVQVIDGRRVSLAEAAAAPDYGDYAHAVYDYATIQPKDGEDIYIWAPQQARVAVTEQPT